ncbi:MAG: sulfite exporter TauE/SafE family protein [Bacteroidales bacterium]|nr:sulfite exporter TauE/SafE family protein [Bacteroidales bacterium]
MEWYFYPILILAGTLVGFINTLAGSGSLISLPLLMYLGLPANIANGTNRVAILLQSLVGVGVFRNSKVIRIREGIWIALPAVIGSIIGAILAVDLNEEVMRKFIGGLMLVMFFLIILKPESWIKGKAWSINPKPGILQIVIFFAIGLYGGFIQAGVGFFLLGGLVLGSGLNLVKANAFKNLIVLLYTPFALTVFILNGQVHWGMGLTLALGNMLGALIAGKMAVKRGAGFVRIILLVVISVAALDMLGLFKLIF